MTTMATTKPKNSNMTSDPASNLNPKKPARPLKARRKRTASPTYSAQEKAQAVLAVWTEKVRPGEVCRQMAIPWMTFSQWQERAMEGMLQALEGRVNLASGQALSPRLQALLQKRPPVAALARLASRLEQLQPVDPKAASTAAAKRPKAPSSKEPSPAKDP